MGSTLALQNCCLESGTHHIQRPLAPTHSFLLLPAPEQSAWSAIIFCWLQLLSPSRWTWSPLALAQPTGEQTRWSRWSWMKTVLLDSSVVFRWRSVSSQTTQRKPWLCLFGSSTSSANRCRSKQDIGSGHCRSRVQCSAAGSWWTHP